MVPPGLWVLSLPIFLASCMETGLRAFVMGSVLLAPPYMVAADTVVAWVATATFLGLPQVRRAHVLLSVSEAPLIPGRGPGCLGPLDVAPQVGRLLLMLRWIPVAPAVYAAAQTMGQPQTMHDRDAVRRGPHMREYAKVVRVLMDGARLGTAAILF